MPYSSIAGHVHELLDVKHLAIVATLCCMTYAVLLWPIITRISPHLSLVANLKI